jgi:hypothetical protein
MLREISDRIRRSDLPRTASTETIRRMLRGTTVPASWDTVYTVLYVLCELAGRTPDSLLTHDGTEGRAGWHLERLWHEALDDPTPRYAQRESGYQPPPAPWDSDGQATYTDEPPF